MSPAMVAMALSRMRRRLCGLIAAAMVLMAIAQPATPAAGAAGDITASLSTPVKDGLKPVDHELAITPVGRGREGLRLAARLSRHSGVIARPVRWRVIALEGAFAGQVVRRATSPRLDFAAPPGRYRIVAGYGTRQAAVVSDIPAGYAVSLKLILDVGAVRLLSRLAGAFDHTPVHARHLIFATGADGGERLVATTDRPGDIVRLAAGAYRIESRIEPGNSIALANVTVKPGILSSLTIAHNSGQARITTPTGGAFAGIVIARRDGSWAWRTRLAGQALDLALAPGEYELRMDSRKERRPVAFSVRAGETTLVNLKGALAH